MPSQVHAATASLAALQAAHRQRMARAHKDMLTAIEPKTSVTTKRFVDRMQGKAVSSGRQNLQRLDKLIKYLTTECGYDLGYLQKELMQIGRIILLKRIFGAELESEALNLQLQFRLRRLYEQAAATLPRRSGKTVVQTILAAVVAATQPDGNVCNFNLGSRQSKEWLAQVLGVLRMLKGTEWDWKLVRPHPFSSSLFAGPVYRCISTAKSVFASLIASAPRLSSRPTRARAIPMPATIVAWARASCCSCTMNSTFSRRSSTRRRCRWPLTAPRFS